jgi:hypothetical protein
MGMKDEAKVEFDMPRSLQRTADETVFRKLHGTHANGKPADDAPGAPTVN